MAHPRPRPLIGPASIAVLADYFSGQVLREIRTVFDDAGIERREGAGAGVGGERRTLVAEYVASLDLNRGMDAELLLRVFEAVLHEMERLLTYEQPGTDPSHLTQMRLRLLDRLQRDGVRLVDGHIHLPAIGVDANPLDDHATLLDAHQIRLQIDRLRQHDADPALAIGTAKELVETTCKTVIFERTGRLPDGYPEIPELVKLACKVLKLAADEVPESARAAEEIRKLLRTLGTIPQTLATIRNAYGTGHGPEGRAKGLQPRHARLAANAAIALCMFLLDTHQER
jgi:hypothetical protein